jgi:serine/threonine-protein kinase ATR
MATKSHSKTVPPGNGNLAAGAPNAAPPPSTLAAQLVHDISATSRSARPDENGELMRFFSIIERVTNDPSILKTTDERIAHNHMLTYVYTHATLGKPLATSPFNEPALVRANALRAINFYKATFKETPAVLACVKHEEELLFRGSDPLWLWVLPQIINLLQSDELLTEILGLLRFVIDISFRTMALWNTAPLIVLYLQQCVNCESRLPRIKGSYANWIDLGWLHSLEDLCVTAAGREPRIQFEIPDGRYIYGTTSGNSHHSQKKRSLTLSASQAIHRATELLSILASQFKSQASILESVAQYPSILPWLFGVLISLQELHAVRPPYMKVNQAKLLRAALDVLIPHSRGVDEILLQKALTTLALFAGKMAECPEDFLREDEGGAAARHTYCVALTYVAEGTAKYRPIGKLVALHVVNKLQGLASAVSDFGHGSDFWVCCCHYSQDMN